MRTFSTSDPHGEQLLVAVEPEAGEPFNPKADASSGGAAAHAAAE